MKKIKLSIIACGAHCSSMALAAAVPSVMTNRTVIAVKKEDTSFKRQNMLSTEDLRYGK